jgi:transcriptional antiterminator Rof (Rho-off)
MESNAPQPISCDIYDELELLALRHTRVRIRWKAEGEAHEVMDRIRTFAVAEGREWAILESGNRVPLDALTEVTPLPER